MKKETILLEGICLKLILYTFKVYKKKKQNYVILILNKKGLIITQTRIRKLHHNESAQTDYYLI